MANLEQQIFKRGSTTYYWSSRFFPQHVRGDVFKLYSFLRTVDDYVDTIPQQTENFNALRAAWRALSQNSGLNLTLATIDDRILKNMAAIAQKYEFGPAWVDAFFDAMESDLTGKTYKTLDDILGYVYGSAEVIGLMMSKIMGLPSAAHKAARTQGRAMQWINFIRDISEDNALGRQYFPQDELRKFSLKDLQESTARADPDAFRAFLRFEIEHYRIWQSAAKTGYSYIPRRMRLPLQTATGMYDWTAEQIAKDPFIVFAYKVKPSKIRVLCKGWQSFVDH